MSSLDNLWELQEIRKKYLALKKREQSALNNQEVQNLKGKLGTSREKHTVINLKFKGLERDINKRELDCRALEDKKKTLQDELYSGNANAKELSGMQQRLEKTEVDLSAVEEDLMSLSEDIEVLQVSLESLHQDITELDDQLAVLQANLEVELQGIRHEMAEVKKAHGAVLKKIDQKALNLYNKKFKQFSVTTMAKVTGGLCTGCKVHLPRYLIAEVKRRDSLVGCENCGRILYYVSQSELS